MPDIVTTRFTFKIDGLSSPTWVARFEAVEAVSSLFEVQLTLSSDDKDIAFPDVIGKPALLTLEADGFPSRYLNGVVSKFRHADDGKKLAVYYATVVPKLWRLRHRHDARIFQARKVPEILQAVLSAAGVSFRLSLSASYSAREYCVQYRESDFAFISRLMEEEGIYYWFEHSEGDHVMVLADTPSAPAPIAGPDTLPFKSVLGAMAFGEGVSRFSYAEEVRTGKVTLTDFNFKKPSLSLLESSAAQLDADLEVYDYPGEYEVPDDGTAYSKVRLEEQQARRALAEGETGCVRLTPGYLFTLSDHPRDSDNQKYLITRLRHRGSQAQMGEAAGGGGEGPGYHNAFQAIPASVPYRPERVTARPTVRGVQTAIVTGPAGEEVYTDEHGRVKVHFHWDRQGKKDDTSSCWIRVSQVWAGAGWGAMWIPRIGHEVIVDFLEGDPDRPIITGRVYHGANVPPYPLPAEKTKSTIKSNSSIGGGGNNELRFEDKKGQEEIWLHGQKDWNIKIEHDKNQLVGHDETKKVGHDETVEIGHDQTLQVDHDRRKQVKNDQSEKIGGNKSIDVTKSHTETIGGNESLDVSGERDVSVGKNHSESVSGNQSVDVGGDQSTTVSKGLSLTVGKDKAESVSGDSNESVTKAKTITVNGEYALTVAKDGSIKFAKNLKEEVGEKKTVVVGEELSIQVGDAVITLKKNGDISVAGKKITVKGTGPVEVQGSKIQVKSDGDVSVEASGKVSVKGSTVGVN